MKINEKNNKAIKNSNIDDRNISKDFSEIFDTLKILKIWLLYLLTLE